MNKTVFTSFTILCLSSALFLIGLSFNLPLAKASETIYIRADGAIDPPMAPISSADNVTYTFTGNTLDGIVVERDNIVVDGAGYTLGENRYGLVGTGMKLRDRNNIIIKNIEIKNFYTGILLYGSSNITLAGNNVTATEDGIELAVSSHCNISGNHIINNTHTGIVLYESPNNRFSGNVISANRYNFGVWGVALDSFIHSIDTSNVVDDKPVYYLVNQTDLVMNSESYPKVGYLGLINCTNITVEGLNPTNNWQGILLAYTNYSKIAANNIANNRDGLYIRSCSHNVLSGNDITANQVVGIFLASSLNNTLGGNNIINNYVGIDLYESSNNTLEENNIANNNNGISLSDFSDHNRIYHNNFIDNTLQASDDGDGNAWDNGYPSGGNYWSDYTNSDIYYGKYQNETGYDWISDSPRYLWVSRDEYPLMEPFVPEKEEIRIVCRNLLLKYNELLSHLKTLNSTLYKSLDNITDLQRKHDSLLTPINNMQEQINSLNSTLQTSVNELQEQYNSMNATLTSIQEATIKELSSIRNIMYIFIATTIILMATTVYLAIRKPKIKP